MSFKDSMFAILVVAIWGFNFVVIKWGLHDLNPLSLAAFRFFFVCFPLIFFLKRPKLPWRMLLAFSMTQSFGQFAFLFSAIAVGMPAGLTSVVLQSQAMFTLIISSLIFKEKFTRAQVVGLLVASAGLVLIASPFWLEAAPKNLSGLGFLFTICAAICWASGNIILKQMSKGTANLNMLNLVVWASLPLPILFALGSFVISGNLDDFTHVMNFNSRTVFCILYLSIFASMVGYGVWNHLIQKYSAVRVAPYSLLVPLFGLSSAYIALSESPNHLQLVGSVVLLCGLVLNQFADRLLKLMFSSRS